MKEPLPQSPGPKKKTFLFVLLGFGVFFILSFIFILFAIQHLFGKVSGTPLISSSNEISLVEIQGPIYRSDIYTKRIRRFRKSDQKALIIRLNSPGGVVAPAQEIYSEIISARAAKKIVVASMGDMAASGAYYIAAACDRIVANPGSLTGSIGVIAEFPDASGFLQKVGLNLQTVKSGKFKDTGSLGRPLSGPERQYLQETIDDVFEQFLDAVIQGRQNALQQKISQQNQTKPEKITFADIRRFIIPYADGRVLTGKKAFELGLVDQLGSYYDAVRLTADMAGIKGEPTVRQTEPIKWEQWLDSIVPFSFLSRYQNGFQLEYRLY
jgi:protease IV